MDTQTDPRPLRIAFCGPIAAPGAPARGGYEAANRRLIEDLRARGIQVSEYPYAVTYGSTLAKTLGYGARFLGIMRELIASRGAWDILHLTPLYKQFIYAEVLLCMVVWMLGKRIVLDIRAGAFTHYYRTRGRAYRALVDYLLGRAEVVAVEGMEYVPFARQRHAGEVFYFPNYVSDAGETPSGSLRARETRRTIRLVYLGRIVPEKGVETAIGALETLAARGRKAVLDVIGSGDEDYVATLKARTGALPVNWLGPQPSGEVRAIMRGAHFFIFPTRHLSEGHSNALTEAMAEGLVPVCSDNGFNRSVADKAGYVLPATAPPEDYAEAIQEIWDKGDWPRHSRLARERVRTRYNGETVLSGLIREYQAALA